MRAATQLGRELAHAYDPHFLAILLAEQRHGAGLDGVVMLHHPRRDRVVGAHLCIDQRLHLGDLRHTHRLVVREVETGLAGVDQRTLLRYMIAQHLAQRGVHQVGGRVVPCRTRARRGVNYRAHSVTQLEGARRKAAMVAKNFRLDLLRVFNRETAARGHQFANVAHLAAGFGVERRAVEHHDAGVAAAEFVDGGTVDVQRHHLAALDDQLVIAFEMGLGT